jgi:hypothetical protein
LAVNANTYGVRVHVSFPDDEHGVDFHLLGALDFLARVEKFVFTARG